MSRTPAAPDARPVIRVVDDVATVDGWSCPACQYATLLPTRRCPVCDGPVETSRFGPDGTLWSHTVVRIPFGGRQPPYALAYVDLDGGPRLLVHLEPASSTARVGSRLRLTRSSADGDPMAEIVGD